MIDTLDIFNLRSILFEASCLNLKLDERVNFNWRMINKCCYNIYKSGEFKYIMFKFFKQVNLMENSDLCSIIIKRRDILLLKKYYNNIIVLINNNKHRELIKMYMGMNSDEKIMNIFTKIYDKNYILDKNILYFLYKHIFNSIDNNYCGNYYCILDHFKITILENLVKTKIKINIDKNTLKVSDIFINNLLKKALLNKDDRTVFYLIENINGKAYSHDEAILYLIRYANLGEIDIQFILQKVIDQERYYDVLKYITYTLGVHEFNINELNNFFARHVDIILSVITLIFSKNNEFGDLLNNFINAWPLDYNKFFRSHIIYVYEDIYLESNNDRDRNLLYSMINSMFIRDKPELLMISEFRNLIDKINKKYGEQSCTRHINKLETFSKLIQFDKLIKSGSFGDS